MHEQAVSEELIRERIRVIGVVQGVGFRPFIYRLAHRWQLRGMVLNDGQGVLLEVQGPPGTIEAFVAAIRMEAPPLARVEQLIRERIPCGPDGAFRIEASGPPGGTTLIPPDAATCPACLRELHDPANRRYRYPFTNCTDCGPRYTIIRALPYDRQRTTMVRFPLCPACLQEYSDPLDRRFHAEPNACPVCGPRLQLLLPEGSEDPQGGTDPLAAAAALLERGGILALKGLGGYHLACDATRSEVVGQLRAAKGRDRKPFAVMVRDLEAVRRLAWLDEAEAAALQAPSRPIVLLRRREPFPLAPEVAPGLGTIGVLLPYTPLHDLLLAECHCPVLVMTSGNRSADPIVIDEPDALDQLGPLVDRLLVHDRPIQARADDSVGRVMGGRWRPLRRSRGLAPEPVDLPPLAAAVTGAVLGAGGALKHTLSLASRGRAWLSPHIGDLESPATRDLLDETAAHLQQLLGLQPRLVVHDAHPDYPSTRWARSLGLPALALQHHHAHALACLAEHRRRAPCVALTLDGTGYGTDGTLWGGEVLGVDGLRCTRLGHLQPRALPGGDQAAREPWRMALTFLEEGQARPSFPGVEPRRVEQLAHLLAGVGAAQWPRTSALGRLLDAAAALLGLCSQAGFEGEGPIRLEDAATRWFQRSAALPPRLPWSCHEPAEPGGSRILDLGPALRELPALRAQPELAAAALHRTVVEAFAELTVRACQEQGHNLVVASGGVLQNRLFHEGFTDRLTQAGLEVLTHRQVPANDGGLALGQAWAGLLALEGGRRNEE